MAFETDIFSGCEGLLYCLAVWANTVTFGAFWTVVTIAFVIVLFMATSRLGTTRAFGFATFGGGMASIILAILGLMPWYITTLFIILLGLGIVIMKMSEN